MAQTASSPGGARAMVLDVVRPIVAGLLLLGTLLGLIATAIHDPKPHDIAVGLVGPAPATSQISGAFAQNAPGTFSFTTYSSEADAWAAIDSRDVDGALVLGGGPPKLIVAGAAGDTPVGVMTAALTNVFQAQGTPLQVETVHPFASGDAHGLVLFFVIVAVIISTLVAQVAFYALAPHAGTGAGVAVIAGYAVLAGPSAMGLADWIIGGFGTDLLVAMALVSLASAAVGAVVAGCIRLLGAPGIGLSVLVVVLLDLVSSGGPGGSQILPDFYRALAPWMPAPQLFSALRGALYFDGSGVTGPVIVLAAWLAGGLVLLALGGLIAARRPAAAPLVAPAH